MTRVQNDGLRPTHMHRTNRVEIIRLTGLNVRTHQDVNANGHAPAAC
jgi:hypothetical protein